MQHNAIVFIFHIGNDFETFQRDLERGGFIVLTIWRMYV